jgi:hypothetical protein
MFKTVGTDATGAVLIIVALSDWSLFGNCDLEFGIWSFAR